MHPTTPSPRLAVLVAVVFALGALAGCINSDAREAADPEPQRPGFGTGVWEDDTSPEPSDTDDDDNGNSNGNGDIAQPDQDPEDPGEDPEPGPEPTPLPASWTATAHDGRTGAWEAPRVEARVEWTGSVVAGSHVRVDWDAPDGTNATDHLDPDGANGTLTVLRDFPGGLGTHEVSIQVAWTAADGQVEWHNATITLEVWESLRVIADASRSYTSDQNVFREDRLVAFAPTAEESAHDLIHRLGDTYGFSVQSHYREDFESWFVDAINGTEFQWAQPEALGISYNWMLLVNGEQMHTAADDTFPELGDVVEFRYVKCYSTGQCDGV